MSEGMNNRWICPNCGTENEKNFCANCGSARAGYRPAAPAPAPVKDKDEFTSEDRKKANRLCIISLILTVGLPFLFGLIYGTLMYLGADDQIMEYVLTLSMFPLVPCDLAGFIIMIVVRVKYRRSVFGLILMILYIVLFVLACIALVYFVVAFVSVCTDATW